MTIILNGTAGITYPDGTTQVDGLSTPVPVADGGTGSATAADARTALGVAIGTDVLAPNGSGANLTALNANNIASGTLAVARGGTGTTSTTFCSLATNVTGTLPVANGGTGTASPSLVGGTNITISGTWPNQTVTAASGAPTTAQVLSATAGATAGAVGTYNFANNTNGGSKDPNVTISGSGLQYSNASGTIGGGTVPSGTYRCMGYAGSDDNQTETTVWLRIS